MVVSSSTSGAIALARAAASNLLSAWTIVEAAARTNAIAEHVNVLIMGLLASGYFIFGMSLIS
jgi:hypothetical protein